MTSFDAVFLAIAIAIFLERSKHSYLAALAPLITVAIGFAPIGDFRLPVTALAVCLVARQHAAVALVLAIAGYDGVFDAVRASLLWIFGTVLCNELGKRSDAAELPPRAGGASIRLFICGVLYFTLLPVSYL